MSTSATFAQFGLASTVSDPATGLSGPIGQQSTRKSMPLALIEYQIPFAFDGSGDAITVDTNDGTATGAVTGVKATGTITYTGLPAADETVTVNSIVYTFKAAAALATEITIGADATETASNTAAAITANDPLVDAVNVAGVVTISAAATGEYGNAYTLAESAANTAVSGATLTGGVDKVQYTGDGVDALGDALPAAAAIHGLLLLVTAGSVTAALGSVVKDTVLPNGGFQTWSAPGRADLLGNLVLTSGAAGTAGTLIVRASE